MCVPSVNHKIEMERDKCNSEDDSYSESSDHDNTHTETAASSSRRRDDTVVEKTQKKRKSRKSSLASTWFTYLILPGITHPLRIRFPRGKLPVCVKCKGQFKTRKYCREPPRNHRSLPWCTTYICITFNESCFDKDDKLKSQPFITKLLEHTKDSPSATPWRPYKFTEKRDIITVKKSNKSPNNSTEESLLKSLPMCADCKQKRYTGTFCRGKNTPHRYLPWNTIYVDADIWREGDEPATDKADEAVLEKMRKIDESYEQKPIRNPFAQVHASRTLFVQISATDCTVEVSSFTHTSFTLKIFMNSHLSIFLSLYCCFFLLDNKWVEFDQVKASSMIEESKYKTPLRNAKRAKVSSSIDETQSLPYNQSHVKGSSRDVFQAYNYGSIPYYYPQSHHFAHPAMAEAHNQYASMNHAQFHYMSPVVNDHTIVRDHYSPSEQPPYYTYHMPLAQGYLHEHDQHTIPPPMNPNAIDPHTHALHQNHYVPSHNPYTSHYLTNTIHANERESMHGYYNTMSRDLNNDLQNNYNSRVTEENQGQQANPPSESGEKRKKEDEEVNTFEC